MNKRISFSSDEITLLIVCLCFAIYAVSDGCMNGWFNQMIEIDKNTHIEGKGTKESPYIIWK